jgi:hypothetical protein
MSLGFYSKSEANTVSLCPDGIGQKWDQTDMGSDGHGIPSGIDVTFRGIPSGIGRTWDRKDLGSIRIHLSLRADSVVWLSHTSSILPWSGAP